MTELFSHPPVIIHAHYGYRAITSMNLIRQLNIPLVVHFYGYDLSEKTFLQRAKKQYETLFDFASAFLVEGPAMRQKLMALGCPEEKIHLHRISIIPERYSFKPRDWDGKRPIKFLFIGRLVEKKGLMTAFNALKKLGQPFPWELSIVGDGEGMSQAVEFVTTHGLTRSVKFYGSVNPRSLPKIINEHDILFQPSQKAKSGDSEGGAPTVLLEAQASGMPIIATTHDDIPFVVSKESAFLSEERDSDSLHKNILKMVDQHQNWPVMSKSGLDFIKRHHDVKTITAKLEALYDTLV